MSFTACRFHGIVSRGVTCVHQKLGSIFGHNGYNFSGYSNFEWLKLTHMTN